MARCSAVERTALITGGTGGLGRAVVGAFAASGWRVVVPDVAPADLEGAEVVEADLTDVAEGARVVEIATGHEALPRRTRPFVQPGSVTPHGPSVAGVAAIR